MDRTEMINMLVENLRRINQSKILGEDLVQHALDLGEFLANERRRYESMSTQQLQGMVLINC